MKRNIKIIIISVVISLFIGMLDVKIVFNDSNTMLQILLSLLGLCLTSYTFVLVPIQNILKDNKVKRVLINNLLKEYKEDMLFIFISCILFIIIDLVYRTNIPLISNPLYIDFGLFKIYSLKLFFKIVLEDILCILCLNSFYDIMQSVFVLVNNSIINDD